jgi:Protein of unknown function (DUF4056)
MAGLLLSIADLCDALYNKVSASPSSGPVPPPGVRYCCLLSKTMLDTSIIVEPIPESYRHFYGARGFVPKDVVGQMYTTAGGFIDFGHLRDLGDLTKYYYDVLRLSAHQGDTIKPPVDRVRATVTLLHDVPEDKQLDVARSMAYGEAVFHEIETYWSILPGCRNSSFSPEDLVSNFFGTYVAAKAIRFGTTGDYNTNFTRAMKEATEALGSVTGEQTAAALDHVEDTWFQSGIHELGGYLLRRNFSVWPLHPWLVDGIGMTGTGSFPSSTTPDFAIADDAPSFYVSHYSVAEHSQGPDKIDAKVVTDADFEALIESIRVAALKDFGEAYDSPFPVGRVGP